MRANRLRQQAGFTLIELMVVIVILGILAAIATNSYMGAMNKAKIADVKVNMHAIQLGIEHYASDNYGNYPDGLQDTGFTWSSYAPQNPSNPFNPTEQGEAATDPDMKLDPGANTPVFPTAQTYNAVGNFGRVRYFSDTVSHSTYALIGEDQNGKPIKESGQAGAINFTIHN